MTSIKDYWDEEQTFIFALLSGYIELEEHEVVKSLNELIRRQPNGLFALWQMELDGLIKFRSIRIQGDNTAYTSLLDADKQTTKSRFNPLRRLLVSLRAISLYNLSLIL